MLNEREATVSGALAIRQRDAMVELVGQDIVDAALERMPRDVREAYTSMGMMTRISAQWVEDVYYAVAREAHRDALRLHRDIVRVSVEGSLKSVWRVLLRFTSDDALVRRTQLLFSKALSRGQLESRIIQPGTAEIRLTGWPGASELQINGIAAAVSTVLSCAGRKHVRTTSHSTIDGACIMATWLVQ